MAEDHGLNPALKYGPIVAQLADAYTTRRAIKAGGHEGNSAMEPFANNEAVLYASKALLGLGTGLLADHLAKSGHKTLGKILSGLSIAVPLGAAAHNEIQRRALLGKP